METKIIESVDATTYNKLMKMIKKFELKPPDQTRKTLSAKMIEFLNNKIIESFTADEKMRKENQEKYFDAFNLKLVPYRFEITEGKYVKKYGTNIKKVRVIGENVLNFEECIRNMAYICLEGKTDYQVQITAIHPSARPISSKVVEADNISKEFMAKLMKVMDYKDRHINDVEFHISIVKKKKGGKRTKCISYEGVYGKKSIRQIKNNENLCLARSIVTALADKYRKHLEEKLDVSLTDNEISYIKQSRNI